MFMRRRSHSLISVLIFALLWSGCFSLAGRAQTRTAKPGASRPNAEAAFDPNELNAPESEMRAIIEYCQQRDGLV
jgi:PBP1b-binding outer membrane lipoprotein LpoB